MKRSALVLLCLLVGLFPGACALGKKASTSMSSAPVSATTTTVAAKETSSAQTSSTPSSGATATTQAMTTTEATTQTVQTTSASSTSVTTSTTTKPTQPSGPKMYSSYAFLVSFDPASNIAEFDYFDMLLGKEAVDFLVKYEDYSKDEAQELVDNFADSEFVLSNLNDQLREIDLAEVSLSLMYQPSGDMSESGPIPSSLADFQLIYELDPLLLTDSFFFYIDVTDSGRVKLVEQVYWP